MSNLIIYCICLKFTLLLLVAVVRVQHKADGSTEKWLQTNSNAQHAARTTRIHKLLYMYRAIQTHTYMQTIFYDWETTVWLLFSVTTFVSPGKQSVSFHVQRTTSYVFRVGCEYTVYRMHTIFCRSAALEFQLRV